MSGPKRKDGAQQQQKQQQQLSRAARYLYLLIPRRIASSHKIVEYLRLGLHQRNGRRPIDGADQPHLRVQVKKKKENLDVTAIKVDEFSQWASTECKIIK